MTTIDRTSRFEVTNGPGKFDLMVAVFEGKRLTFTLSGPSRSEYVVQAYVIGVQAEDGSKRSWNIEGVFNPPGHERDTVNFTGYYHSDRRQGTVYLSDLVSEVGEMLTHGELRQYRVKTR